MSRRAAPKANTVALLRGGMPMNASAALRAGVARGGRPPDTRASAAGIGLWVFMGVATALFSLFVMAYVMRMNGSDAVAIALPWQLWLSSTLLAIGSVALQRSATAARGAEPARARRLLWAGGLCALAFLAVQLWAWQALTSTQV